MIPKSLIDACNIMIQPASKDWIQQAFVREFGNKMAPDGPTDFYYNENGYRVMTESYH
jgi:hypothetical protein